MQSRFEVLANAVGKGDSDFDGRLIAFVIKLAHVLSAAEKGKENLCKQSFGPVANNIM